MGEDSLLSRINRRTFGFPLYRKPEDLLTSYFVSPKTLFLYRVFACVWIFIVLITHWILDEGAGNQYFTFLTYEILFFYFALVVALSLIRKSWQLKKPWLQEELKEADENHSNPHIDRFCKFIIVVGETVAVNEVVVVIVYWALLSGGYYSPAAAYVNINVHALSWPMIWVDYALNTTPFHYSHVVYILLELLCYMFFGWFYESQFRVWIYFFLDYRADAAVIFYIGLLAAFVVIYFIVFGCVVVRNKIYQALHPRDQIIDLVSLTKN